MTVARYPHARAGHPFLLFFFNDTATTEIYPLSLHDALPISLASAWRSLQASILALGRETGREERALALARGLALTTYRARADWARRGARAQAGAGLDRDALEPAADRKSTRLNSSHANISYAV